MFILQAIWFLLIAVLLAGYVVLDGFDLGVGFWFLAGREDDRKAMLSAVAPFWDGNEVWLVTGGGALFAAFPHVYATVFSGFYLAMMLLLFALIFRGVAIEFRGKVDSARWREFWDMAFAMGSTVTAVLLGVAMGNILRGIPLDAEKNFTGTFLSLLNPYSLLIGGAALSIIAAHGALYLAIKTAGEIRRRAARWAAKAVLVEAVLVLAAGVATAVFHRHLLRNYRAVPALWALPVGAAVVLGLLVLACRRGRAGAAFLLSAGLIVVLGVLAGVGLFPYLVPASNDATLSLTVTNASSSARTLTIMLVLALAGMPIVIGYQAWLYWTFRRPVDKVKGSLDY